MAEFPKKGPSRQGRNLSHFLVYSMMTSPIKQIYGLFGVLLLLLPFSLHAQAPVPTPAQTAPIALEGATIHTMAGQVIENGSILFENGVITRIGTDISARYPAGTQRRDVSGKHIYPGLIDAWNQIGIYEIGAVGMSTDINEQGPVNPNARVERSFNPESRHIAVGRSAGVLTSVTTPGGGLVSGQSAAMMMDGWTWEEMTLKSGLGMIINWPNARNAERYAGQLEALQDVFDNARAYRRARIAMEAGRAPHHDFDARLHAMIPLFEGEMPVVVNANEVQQIQDAVTWAESEGLDIILLGGRDAPLVAHQLREKDVPVIVTTVLSSPFRNWEAYDTRYALPLKLHEAGVRFAIAGGNSAANVNRLPFEAGAAAAFGLPVEAALRALTAAPAEILGLDHRIGTLEVGKDATLLITSGNPIEYSTQVEQVFIAGRESDMMDAHRELYQKYREKLDQQPDFD